MELDRSRVDHEERRKTLAAETEQHQKVSRIVSFSWVLHLFCLLILGFQLCHSFYKKATVLCVCVRACVCACVCVCVCVCVSIIVYLSVCYQTFARSISIPNKVLPDFSQNILFFLFKNKWRDFYKHVAFVSNTPFMTYSLLLANLDRTSAFNT